MNLFNLWRFLRLLRERFYTVATIMQFGIIGALGLVIDLSVLYLLLSVAPFWLARICAVATTMVCTFCLNRAWTFKEASNGSLCKQFVSFVMACSCGAILNWITSTSLNGATAFFHDYPLCAGAAGSLAGFAVNYVLVRCYVFDHSGAEAIAE